MNNKSNNKEHFQTSTTSSAPLFVDAGYWYDDETSANDQYYRTISPRYIDLTILNENQPIWKSDMSNEMNIRLDNSTPRFLSIYVNNILNKTGLPDITLSDLTQNIVDQWNTWAYNFAISNNFDTWGYQAGGALFFGKYGTTYTRNGITYTYKYDSKSQFMGETSLMRFGSYWINHVYTLPSVQTIRASRATTAGQTTTARGTTTAGQTTAGQTTAGQTTAAPVVQSQAEQPTKLQTASAIVTSSSLPQDALLFISKNYILIGILILLIIYILIIKKVILY